ncbi:uncharacterized protein QC763_0031340 [Podospora pseudopauciseta]|uniref:Uncharacterized protein n=1 Tax=Podospora pseudopauciseta TaxID=2093780 RepID=A0ABR0HN41_9PEZI|nr:hypothetical protein QC763_0031340 [Podospora pseudopauciseta]
MKFPFPHCDHYRRGDLRACKVNRKKQMTSKYKQSEILLFQMFHHSTPSTHNLPTLGDHPNVSVTLEYNSRSSTSLSESLSSLVSTFHDS